MFMAMPMLYRFIAILLAIAVVAGGWMLYIRERNNFADYRSDVAAAVKAQQDKTNLITKQQKQVTKKAEETYAKDVASIRSVYDGLRKSNGGSAVSNVPDSTKDPLGATTYYVSIAPDLASRCAETTNQVIALQDWVKQQGEVHDNN